MYKSAGCIDIASGYGRDLYDNSIDFFFQTQRHVSKLYLVY